MMLIKKKRVPFLISILFFIFLLSFILICFPKVANQVSKEKQQALEDALQRACLQCYAIEGRYPPNIRYLKKHYGVVIDDSKFEVFYDIWADNIFPDITVINLDSLEGDAYETE